MKKKTKNNLRTQLQPWIERFVNEVPHLAKKTCWLYQYTILDFVLYLEKISNKKRVSPTALKREAITGWLKETRTRYSINTVLGHAGTVSRFLSFLEKNGCLEKNPLDQLQKKYPKKGLKGIVLALTGPLQQKSLQALKSSPRFTSPLGPYMQKFIALGRAQGKVYRAEGYILSRFDRFLKSYSSPPRQLSDSILIQWLNLFSKCSPECRYKNFKVVQRFCLYLRRFDSTAYVPDSSLSPRAPSQFLPYIYSRDEIMVLLKAIRKLKSRRQSPLRPHMFYVLILLLYTTGMRLGEVLKLQLRDINQKDRTLYIHKTKFFKSRLVPLSLSMMKKLEGYIELRRRSGTPNNPKSYLFYNQRREKHYSLQSIQHPFRKMLQCLGLKPPRGYSGPRLHDLRATFAVHRLEEWYRQGVDVQSRLGSLSTYLGHINIASTQRYLPMTAELLQQASQRFKKYFKSKQEGEKKDEK